MASFTAVTASASRPLTVFALFSTSSRPSSGVVTTTAGTTPPMSGVETSTSFTGEWAGVTSIKSWSALSTTGAGPSSGPSTITLEFDP